MRRTIRSTSALGSVILRRQLQRTGAAYARRLVCRLSRLGCSKCMGLRLWTLAVRPLGRMGLECMGQECMGLECMGLKCMGLGGLGLGCMQALGHMAPQRSARI